MPDITFEWLDGPDSEGPRRATQQEWERIDDICAERSWMPLNRMLTRILVAKRGDEIVAFHVLQLLPHAEPQWVAEGELGSGLAQQMADQMVAYLQGMKARGWMVVADSAHAERMCKEHGMVRVKSPVYRTQ